MLIKVTNLSKTIKGNTVLDNINISLESGNIYGFVGKNGSGKTMLLRAIAGLIVPSDGNIMIDEKLLHKDISFPPNIGVLIEKPEFLGYMNGIENLMVLSEIQGKITKNLNF